MKSNICRCGSKINEGRIELGFTNCISCAEANPVSKYKGAMNWSHKTAPTLQVMSSECWDNQKKYYVAQGARSAVKNFSKNVCA
tara:strand:- start:543 stop:794 length:252 start_codon:yes stop_codon:yes gene_type:complete